MEVMVTKRLNGLTPATEQDAELLNSIKVGDTVRAKINRPRNPQHHAKMFALLNIVLANTDKYRNIEDLLLELKLRVGHYQEHITSQGEVVYVPKSISFASMDQASFDVFYKKAVNAVIDSMLPGMDERTLENEIRLYMSFL